MSFGIIHNMISNASSSPSNAPSSSVLAEENALLREQVQTLQHQLDWFKKQLFGAKSEKRLLDTFQQAGLFDHGVPAEHDNAAEPKRTVRAYRRGTAKKQRDDDCLNDTGLRFNADVPVEVVEHQPPELTGVGADQYEILGIKTTYRLAQRPSSYVVLCMERPVFRRKGTAKPVTAPALPNVLDNSLADVSLLAGMLVDKFQFHLPLYRQHQRIQQTGITISRSTPTHLVQRAIELLRPIVDAQTENVLRSRVLAMDETPIKAGRRSRPGGQPGKMKTGWFWPLYGDADEVVFTYSASRGRAHIEATLDQRFRGTLISDGYAAYARYARNRDGVTHAQCWVHARRYFIEAQPDHPERASEALRHIARLYRIEKTLQNHGLTGEAKRQYRLEHALPMINAFFQWCQAQSNQGERVPSDRLVRALNYVLRREASLRVFLENPEVPLDTNHLERALRPIPLGRKNWLFSWSELGAEHVGLIQSLITTCQLHGVNPYTYLVDVLQRISQHPAREVKDLTPRRWKTRFADMPLRSLIDPRHPDRQSKPPEAIAHAH